MRSPGPEGLLSGCKQSQRKNRPSKPSLTRASCQPQQMSDSGQTRAGQPVCPCSLLGVPTGLGVCYYEDQQSPSGHRPGGVWSDPSHSSAHGIRPLPSLQRGVPSAPPLRCRSSVPGHSSQLTVTPRGPTLPAESQCVRTPQQAVSPCASLSTLSGKSRVPVAPPQQEARVCWSQGAVLAALPAECL